MYCICKGGGMGTLFRTPLKSRKRPLAKIMAQNAIKTTTQENTIENGRTALRAPRSNKLLLLELQKRIKFLRASTLGLELNY